MKRNRAGHRKASRRPGRLATTRITRVFEALEGRRLLAGDTLAELVTTDAGVLRVEGTASDDVIAVRQVESDLEVTMNDATFTVPGAQIHKIEVFGRAGNDQISIAENVGQAVHLEGNEGDDVISAASSGGATILGGAGNDAIRGTDSRDRIDGGPGDDKIAGRGGNDYLRGGIGRDTIDGGEGNDSIMGDPANLPRDQQDVDDGTLPASLIDDAGTTTLADAPPADTPPGDGDATVPPERDATFDDVIDGGPGHDRIFGQRGRDQIRGGTGNDYIRGGAGRDWISGDAGHDTINGDRGNDVVFGGAGNDHLGGRSGNDVVVGGSGRDRISGGTGDDWLLGDATDAVPDEPVAMHVFASRADEGDRAAGDQIRGDDGDDVILAGPGNDQIDAGDGADYVQGGAGSDRINGNHGNDLLLGDSLRFVTDELPRPVDDDAGEEGPDGGSVTDLPAEANERSDRPHTGRPTGGDKVDPPGPNPRPVPQRATFNDQIRGGEGNDWIFGQRGNDDLDGGNGDDHVSGNDGRDRIVGGLGDDLLLGGNDADRIFGGAGNDSIRAGGGSDLVLAGTGNDRVDGGAGSDVLLGQQGDDKIAGGNGRDVLVGGLGSDHLDGGQAADWIFAVDGLMDQLCTDASDKVFSDDQDTFVC